MFKVNFILEAYTGYSKEFPKTFVEATPQSDAIFQFNENDGACALPIDPIQKEIQNVLDVLPHLESSFVRKLLTRYENTESAISAVLEGNLPPDLDTAVDIQLVEEIESKPSISTIQEVTNLMKQIDFNIDENTKVISKERRIQAIRPKLEKRILDDKSHIKDLQERYVEYGYVTDDYDDEYDDSYDALTESETKSVTKNLRHSGALDSIMDDVDDDESDSNDEEISSGRDTRNDFCENPEAVRERWAQHRQAKYGSKPAMKPAA